MTAWRAREPIPGGQGPRSTLRGGNRDSVRQLADHGKVGEAVDLDISAVKARKLVSHFFLAGTARVEATGPDSCRLTKWRAQE